MPFSRTVLVVAAVVVVGLIGIRAFDAGQDEETASSTTTCSSDDLSDSLDRFLEEPEACTQEFFATDGAEGDVVEVVWSYDGQSYSHVSGPLPSIGEAGATSHATGESQSATFLVINEAGDVVVRHQVNVGDAALIEIRYPDLEGAETVVVEQDGGEAHREVYA